MRIGKVIGSVTLNRALPSFAGTHLKLAIPLLVQELQGTGPFESEELVVWDELNAGVGSTIAISEGGEASQPFRPELKPVDAYASAILDHIHITDLETK